MSKMKRDLGRIQAIVAKTRGFFNFERFIIKVLFY